MELTGWRLGLVLIYLIANLICFTLMFADKRFAKGHMRRIPERTLFLSAFLLGGAGGTAAMFAFRHKTKHANFRNTFPLLAAAQAAIVLYALLR